MMAKRKGPPEYTRIKKGEIRNPLGGRAHNPEIRALKNLTEQEMVEIGSLVLKGSIKQLKAIAADPNATALKCMMAAVAVRTISKGDPHALEVLLNRLIGKVREEINHTGIPATVQTVVNIDSEQFKVQFKKFNEEF